MKNFSIIIPIYNEEDNINLLVDEIVLNLRKASNYEIIFVNDCSTDKSRKIILDLASKVPIILVDHESNLGQSFAIKNGILKSKYETIVTLDGDGQNNPIDIPNLLNKYFSKPNVFLISGIRKNRKDSFVKIFSSKLANFFRNLILRDGCSDTGCSLKVFNKKTFLLFPFFNGIHRFLPALYVGSGKKIFFIDVDHRPRVHGVTKYGTFGRLFRGIRDLIRVVIIIKKLKKEV